MLSGQLVKRLRIEKGWDQRQLAEAAGVNPSVVSKVERSLQDDVRLSVAVAIAEALGVEVDTLIERASDEDQLAPELEAVVSELMRKPQKIQRNAASLVRTYLETLDNWE